MTSSPPRHRPPIPDEPSPALVDPDPDAGRDAVRRRARVDAYGTWRSTTAASLVDEYFQRLLLKAEACDPAWFDQPYEGPLRVANGASWRAATHTAMASVPDPDARASLYEAQAAFWDAGADCDQLVNTWLDRTEPGLGGAGRRPRTLAGAGDDPARRIVSDGTVTAPSRRWPW